MIEKSRFLIILLLILSIFLRQCHCNFINYTDLLPSQPFMPSTMSSIAKTTVLLNQSKYMVFLAGTVNLNGRQYAGVTVYNISTTPPTYIGRYMNLSESDLVDENIWILKNEYLLTGTKTLRLFYLQNFT